jgi:hypothetical protein
MSPFFTHLGKKILDRWQLRNFSPAIFPEIARIAIEELPPAEHVDVGALVSDFLLEDEQPFQTQSSFGQPELVVFDHPRFYIQLLFWLDGTTDIHQHTFSGAFHVLEGSSLHSRFEFCDAESISAHLQVGNLNLNQTQLLKTGDTVEISSGQSFIHALFHLDTPSITVVVRTHNDPGSGPQFTYLPPHLAVDPLHNDALTNRRKQLLDVLECTGDTAYPEAVAEMVEKLDFERGFFILQNCITHLHALESWDAVWETFASKHGRLADFVLPSIEEIMRRDALVALRASITETEHRFFLALLLNVADRKKFLEMIALRVGGHPERTLARWMDEINASHEDTEWIWKAHGTVLDAR